MSCDYSRQFWWLDRLRASRGFPTTGNLELERYLSSLNDQQNDSSTETHQSVTQNHSPPQKLDVPDTDGGFTKITNALSELFCMGDHVPVSVPGKKCPRKQSNPKFFPAWNSSESDSNNCTIGGALGTRKTDSPSPLSDDNSGVGLLKEVTNCDEQVNLVENVNFVEKGVEEDNAEKKRLTLAGFTRTEVTVIDTSFPGWKYEKMLFRKNNQWKALDKKSKNISTLGKKKRKICAMSEDKNGRDEVRRHIDLHQGSSSKRTKRGSRSCNEEHLGSDKQEAACTKTSVAVEKGPKKNLVEGSSSIALTKSLPKSKKNGTSFPISADLSKKQTKD